MSLQDAEDTAEEALGQNVTAQMTESVVDDRTTLIISVAGNEALLPAEMEALSDALTKSFPDLNVRLVSSDLVAPFIGREMLTNGILAILVSSVLILSLIHIFIDEGEDRDASEAADFEQLNRLFLDLSLIHI